MRKNNHRSTLATAFALIGTLGIGACGLFGPRVDSSPPLTPPVSANVKPVAQGPKWNPASQAAAFYIEDQGSRIMPIAWFKALRLSDGTLLTQDRLARYGYLENPASAAGLPVGFTTGSWHNTEYVGMTCAACHTRQIRVGTDYYRVDGGPALSNLQDLFADVDTAVQRALASDASFAAFAADEGAQDAPAVARLRAEVTAWAGPYHTLIQKALPTSKPWGVGRADAVGMILNRVGGLDIGDTPDHVIAGNIQVADAPTRYPFLWNAPTQDKTQWPGFAPNGNALFALVRNLGEVYGVFGVFHPQPQPGWVGGVNYISNNSANFKGLDRVEQLVRRIGKPDWPWGVNPARPHGVDQKLAERGRLLYENGPDNNGVSCWACHRVKTQHVPFLPDTWKTPLIDVGTDSREYATLQWRGESGIMNGAYLLKPSQRIQPVDSLVTILTTATAGAILQKAGLGRGTESPSQSLLIQNPKTNGPVIVNAVRAPATSNTEFKYEARVLQGIWAAAPYLHNGSVPTLTDLLEPPEKRPAKFAVGIDYDADKVGLAGTQSGPVLSETTTTGCEARNSGNSRCGHYGDGYGTTWSREDKRALLEYLKTL